MNTKLNQLFFKIFNRFSYTDLHELAACILTDYNYPKHHIIFAVLL